MAPDTPDLEPDPTVQLGRMEMITGSIDAITPDLDWLGNLFQTLFTDDYGLPESQRMPSLEAMDLQRAMEDARRGLRAMRRIADLHAHNLKTTLGLTEEVPRGHLSAVPSCQAATDEVRRG